MNSNFSIYLPQADTPSNWGLEVKGVGYADVARDTPYPPSEHPDDHLFDWERGRTLNEYQALLITKGVGTIETAHTEEREIAAPFLILLFPGVWHRYRPREKTGWREYWIAFDGDFPRELQTRGTLSPRSPIHEVGHSDALLAQFQLVHSETQEEALGFRRVCASAIIQILALSTTLPQRAQEESNPMRAVIREACFLMRERADSNLSPEEIASELNIGYTYFRRLFKKYTGLSPKRYHSQIRFLKSKSILANTHLSISEIADRLSFDSPFHFSNWFKKQTGQSPTAWRSHNTPSVDLV